MTWLLVSLMEFNRHKHTLTPASTIFLAATKEHTSPYSHNYPQGDGSYKNSSSKPMTKTIDLRILTHKSERILV
jgi:hypothetical protein